MKKYNTSQANNYNQISENIVVVFSSDTSIIKQWNLLSNIVLYSNIKPFVLFIIASNSTNLDFLEKSHIKQFLQRATYHVEKVVNK